MNRLLNTSSITGSALRADGVLARERNDAREHEMVLRGELRLPAVLDDDGLMRLDDDRGAVDAMPGLRAARACRPRRRARRRSRRIRALRPGEGSSLFRERQDRLGKFRAAADRFDRHRFDDQLLGGVDESELRFMRGFERLLHCTTEAASTSEAAMSRAPQVRRTSERCALHHLDAPPSDLPRGWPCNERRHHQRRIGARVADMRAHDAR